MRGAWVMAALLPLAARAEVLTGAAAFGDWSTDAPGVTRHITPADMAAPYATRSAGNPPRIGARPATAVPHAPAGFQVTLLASGLDQPRRLAVAPNGDVFVAETAAGRVTALHADGSRTVFAAGLDGPFGIAFYPAGPEPRFVYIAELNAVRRYAYRPGAPAGKAETVVAELAPTTRGHTTRDVAFTQDGSRMLVSVGSGSNVADGMVRKDAAFIRDWEATRPPGATWGSEENRADVLSFTPDGQDRRVFATGIRNCVGLAVQPGTGTAWCSTNERDGLGDDLVPDYVTRVREGAFYGWPWYYMGAFEDSRLAGQRPDLRGRATVPDVLLQPHSASLQLAFQDSPAFPQAWRGVFAAEHGSWNRSKRTGYKVIRVVLDAQGAPTGEYQDFLTGFVAGEDAVWGRPVGVAVAQDGSLLVSEDVGGTVWRVTWRGEQAAR